MGGYCCLTSFFSTVDICLSCRDIARQSCAMVPRWRFLGNFLGPVFPESCVQNISDLHSKFALGPVELAALHAAAKNIINLTARTGGMYGGGRPAPFSPSIGCDVLRSTAAVSRSTASEVNGQRVAVILRVASADESWFYAACDNCLKGF